MRNKPLSELIETQLNVRELARNSGQNNQPETSSTAIDANQSKIINFAESEVVDRFKKIKEKLQEKNSSRLDLQAKLDRASDLNAIKEDISGSFYTYKSQKEGTIQNVFGDYTEALRNLTAFKDRNKLTRHADYPDSKIFNFSIILVLLAGETILNAQVFSIGENLGLLGGFFNALIISIINVAAGVITGYFIFPKTNHIDRNEKLTGYFFLAFYIVLIPICFNLLVAHFRAALAVDFQQAVFTAAQSFWANPFGIPNVDSWILFALGAIISFIACYEGYKLDDPYPKYGEFHREKEKKKNSYEAIKTQFYDELDSIVSDGREKLNNSVANFLKYLNRYENSINESKDILNNFNTNFLDEAENAIKLNIQIYRDTNRRVRTSSPPSYFQEESNLTIKENHLLKDPSIENSEVILENKKHRLHSIEDDKAQLVNEISDLRVGLKNIADEFFKELETPIRDTD